MHIVQKFIVLMMASFLASQSSANVQEAAATQRTKDKISHAEASQASQDQAIQNETQPDKLAQVMKQQWQQYDRDIDLQDKQKINQQSKFNFDPQKSDPYFSSFEYQYHFGAHTFEAEIKFINNYSHLFNPAAPVAPINSRELSILIARSALFPQSATHNQNQIYQKTLSAYLQKGIKTSDIDYPLYYDEGWFYDAHKEKGLYYGTTPLHVAILKKDVTAFEKLLSLNEELYYRAGGTDEAFEPPVVPPAHINTRDALGHTPLHLALRMWLADLGASLELHSKSAFDAEPWLNKFIHPLLKAGAWPISQNTRGETILHNMVRIIVADDTADDRPLTILNQNIIHCLQWFEERVLPYSDPHFTNATDFRGHTALVKLALSWSHHRQPQHPSQQLQIFKILTTHGARLSATDEYGRDIRDLLAAAYNTHYEKLGLYYRLEDNALTQHFKQLQPPSQKKFSAQRFSAQEKTFLQAVYNNDIEALKVNLNEAEDNLSSTAHTSGLGDYVIYNALELVAHNDWPMALYVLLNKLKKILPEPRNFDTKVSHAFEVAIRAGARDAVHALVNLFQVTLEPRHLELAIRYNQPQMAHAFLKAMFTPQKNVTESPLTSVSKVKSKNRIKLSPAYFENTGLKDIYVPEQLKAQLNQRLKFSLVPALRTQNLKLVDFVLHFSPASLRSHAYYDDFTYPEDAGKDNVFQVVLWMQPPNLELLDTLLEHSKKESLQDIFNETNYRGETLWQSLAYLAGTRPEYIQEYQEVFRRLVAALKKQKPKKNTPPSTNSQKTRSQKNSSQKTSAPKTNSQKTGSGKAGSKKVSLSERGVITASLFLKIFDASWGRQSTRFQEGPGTAQTSNQLQRYMFTTENKEKHKQLWQRLFDSYAPASCTKLLSKKS